MRTPEENAEVVEVTSRLLTSLLENPEQKDARADLGWVLISAYRSPANNLAISLLFNISVDPRDLKKKEK